MPNFSISNTRRNVAMRMEGGFVALPDVASTTPSIVQ